jgi:hypothetical protein
MCKSTHSATDESSVFAFNNKNLLSVEKYTWETIELATARLSWKNVYLGSRKALFGDLFIVTQLRHMRHYSGPSCRLTRVCML